MSGNVVSVDTDALEFFLNTLADFNNELDTRWGAVVARWRDSSESWRDIKKDQFQSAMGWDEVERMMGNYVATSQQYTNYLRKLYEAAEIYRNV